MKYRSAAITDIGKIRSENEDRFLRDDMLGLFGVADGIGGLPGGTEAAELTVQAITLGVRQDGGTSPDLVAITRTASAAVQELGQAINPPFGIGSTLTFGVFKEGNLHLAHVGDSRAYALRQGVFASLTEDHTVENEALARQARGEKVEIRPESRNALTRCMGQPGVPEVDYHVFPVSAGDRYLFTTDGIFRMIDDPELAEILARADTPDDALKTMLDLALERGGYDNLTAVLLFVDQA